MSPIFLVAVLMAGSAFGAGWPTKHPGPGRKMKDNAEQKKLRAELKDKGKICFATNRDGNWEIYVTSPDGSGQKNLTKNDAWDLYPRWSADGSRIVFYSDRDSDWKLKDHMNQNMTPSHDPWMSRHRDRPHAGLYLSMAIYVMNADGSGVKKIVGPGVRGCLSPDGSAVAYEYNHGITIIDLASGKKHSGMPRRWGGAWFPSFSPDGGKLLCATPIWGKAKRLEGYRATVFYLGEDFVPTDKYRVLANGHWACHPEWSSDGQKVILGIDTRGSALGWVRAGEKPENESGVGSKGAGERGDIVAEGKLLKPSIFDFGFDKDKYIHACPDWSPDDAYVTFSLSPVFFEVKPKLAKLKYEPWDQRGQIVWQELYVGRADGKVSVQITEGGYANRDPDWSK